MKTTTLTYPQYNFIDIAPLAARYKVLSQAILSFVTLGQFCEAMRATQKVRRLIGLYARLDTQNRLWARKIAMLSDRAWRERVLKELGGLRRLRMWEEAQKRLEQRALARSDRPSPKPQPSVPSWLYTPERLAESERLKAHVRKCTRVGLSPLVTRDRFKMDFDGMFRLPPLPRIASSARSVKVYTKNSIVDYDFNPVPFAKLSGFGPAMVWPVEFYAAMGMEMENDISKGCLTTANKVCPVPMPESAPHMRAGFVPPFHSMDSGLSLASQSQGRNDRVGTSQTPLQTVLTPKTYRYIFENPV